MQTYMDVWNVISAIGVVARTTGDREFKLQSSSRLNIVNPNHCLTLLFSHLWALPNTVGEANSSFGSTRKLNVYNYAFFNISTCKNM